MYMAQLLQSKAAVIYGAAGAIGSAVARAFAAEGAQVHLTGHRLSSVEPIAAEINASGGKASAAEVDASLRRLSNDTSMRSPRTATRSISHSTPSASTRYRVSRS
jgi:NAD(P)-dependent dehydrogenase (short-subunit alcohol dehydrogenase family)